MPRILLARPPKIAPYFKKIQRAVTSHVRHGDIRTLSTRNIYFLLLIIFVMTSEGFITNANWRNKHQSSKRADFDLLTRPNCIGCFEAKQEHQTTSQTRLSGLTSPNSCLFMTKVLENFCGKMTVTKCYFVYKQRTENSENRLMKQIFISYNTRCKLLDNNNDLIVIDQKTKFLQKLFPKTPKSNLSRQKRLASSDRRLVFLYCRTNFILQITKSGKVIGNPEKSTNGKETIALLFFACTVFCMHE